MTTRGVAGMLAAVASVLGAGMGAGFDFGAVPDFVTMQTQADVERNVAAAESKRARKDFIRFMLSTLQRAGAVAARRRAEIRFVERERAHRHRLAWAPGTTKETA